MRLSKIGKVVKEARQCVLCNTRERTGQEANLIQQWIGSGEAMYPVDENVRLTEQGAAALMEMEGKEAEAVAWRSVGDGSELAEALKGIPARIDSAALAWKVCLKVEIQSGTVRVTELEDGSMAYVWEALLEPCKRKGKLLRMTRVVGSRAYMRCTPGMTWRAWSAASARRSGRKCCGRCGKSAEYLHIIETFFAAAGRPQKRLV